MTKSRLKVQVISEHFYCSLFSCPEFPKVQRRLRAVAYRQTVHLQSYKRNWHFHKLKNAISTILPKIFTTFSFEVERHEAERKMDIRRPKNGLSTWEHVAFKGLLAYHWLTPKHFSWGLVTSVQDTTTKAVKGVCEHWYLLSFIRAYLERQRL